MLCRFRVALATPICIGYCNLVVEYLINMCVGSCTQNNSHHSVVYTPASRWNQQVLMYGVSGECLVEMWSVQLQLQLCECLCEFPTGKAWSIYFIRHRSVDLSVCFSCIPDIPELLLCPAAPQPFSTRIHYSPFS